MIKNQQIKIEENPNGWWFGFEGKIKFDQFIPCAREAIRRNPDGKFRVVKAEIHDESVYWINYKNPVEHAGVMSHLMATK